MRRPLCGDRSRRAVLACRPPAAGPAGAPRPPLISGGVMLHRHSASSLFAASVLTAGLLLVGCAGARDAATAPAGPASTATTAAAAPTPTPAPSPAPVVEAAAGGEEQVDLSKPPDGKWSVDDR